MKVVSRMRTLLSKLAPVLQSDMFIHTNLMIYVTMQLVLGYETSRPEFYFVHVALDSNGRQPSETGQYHQI